MGKIEGIFATNISGKVGNVVFRKAGKQNIVSQRPASVKNPRTDMQQRQRAYIKTVSSAYSVLKPICDHSFEGVAYGADSMNFFKKENYKIVSSNGKAVLKNSSNVVVESALLISKGSIIWNERFDLFGQIADLTQYLNSKGIANISELSFCQFLEALNLKRGDQITVVSLKNADRYFESPDGLVGQTASDMYFSRYVLEGRNDNDKAFVKIGASSEYYTLNATILSEKSELNAKALLLAKKKGVLEVGSSRGSIGKMYTAIISRKNGDNWLRSTATLQLSGYTMERFDIDEVLPSYSPTVERYLNNAEK